VRDAFIGKLSELAETNPKIFLITGDLGFGVLDKFAEKFPHQYLNAGVAEQNMTGIAAGMALEGRIVFNYSIANFPTLRCLEQIRNDVCYHEANVKIVSIGGGFSYGALGMSHHATEDLSILRSIPKLTILAPGDIWETINATEELVNTKGACYLRIDKSLPENPPSTEEPFKIGKARMVRQGSDITLISTGGILGETIDAAEELSGHGIECRVLSMHTLNPLDHDAIISASKETGGIVSVEEHTIEGGLGGMIAEVCLDQQEVPEIFYRMGLRAGFSSIVGSQSYLRKKYGLDKEAIVSKVLSLCLSSANK
jgi:transketolase